MLVSVGQMLFKRTADGVAAYSLSRFLDSLLGSPHFRAALCVYGAATLLWVLVLSRVPLGRAMPFVALTFVIVPAVGAAFFGERFGERLNLIPTSWCAISLPTTRGRRKPPAHCWPA